MTRDNLKLQDFRDALGLENLIKEPTGFEEKNATCIEHILTNQKQLFMKSRTFFTSMSDFHALMSDFRASRISNTSIMKLTYVKGNPKIKFHKNYKKFHNDLFHAENGIRNLTDSTCTSF